jgi:predicted SAM-dependent methyltransferase
MGNDVRLNIGAGPTALEGFTPIDCKNGDQAYPLKHEDGSVEEIYASHVLEHFSHRNTPEVLKHWVSKLKPGGRLRIAVPDFGWVARSYVAGEPINTQGYVMGGHVDEDDHHKALFDRESLAELMLAAGLEQLHEWKPEIEDCSALPVSLNLAGFKPISDIQVCKNTLAVLSAPRFGPMLHMRVSADAFYRTGVRYIIGQGVYWHQVLCECIESLLADNPELKYVITCDYDTIFTGIDVLLLYRLMEVFPDADSICGIQNMRQDKKTMLCNLKNEDGTHRTEVPTLELLSKQLTPILSGHFGLTIFRAEALRNHPRPWMVPAPNKDDRWGAHRRDADMDFWRRWHEQGRKAFMANRVVLGHMEEVIAWPGDELQPVYQLVHEFAKTGKPAEIWPRCLNRDRGCPISQPSDS